MLEIASKLLTPINNKGQNTSEVNQIGSASISMKDSFILRMNRSTSSTSSPEKGEDSGSKDQSLTGGLVRLK